MPSSARYGVIRSAGRIRFVSTKLGMVCTRSARAARELADDVGPEVVRQHGDGVGHPVAGPLERPGGGDHAGVRDRTGLDGGVGEHVLDVEDERGAVGPGHDPSRQAHRQRGRHRDHGVDPPEPAAGAEAGPAGQDREAGEPRRPPEQVATVAARERVHPPHAPPVGPVRARRPAGPAGLDGVGAVPRQRGDDVQLVAAPAELVDDPGQHPPRRRGVGVEVGPEHDDAQPRPFGTERVRGCVPVAVMHRLLRGRRRPPRRWRDAAWR